MRKRPSPFVFVIVDEDAKTYAVKGPMLDDQAWTNAVCKAQEMGRQVHCFTTTNRDSAISWGQTQGLTQNEHILLTASSSERGT